MFNKGLDSSEKQEGLLKRLKNIADKTDNQLVAIRNKNNRLALTDKLKKIDFYNLKVIGLENLLKKLTKQLIKLKELKMLQEIKSLINIHQNLLIIVQMVILIILTST